MILINPDPKLEVNKALGVSESFAAKVLDLIPWIFTEPNISVNQAIASAVKECDPISPSELFFVAYMAGAATVEVNLHEQDQK